MREVLEAYPGAQRALFRRYHIGGCSSCGFQPEETLEQVCGRNGGVDVNEALDEEFEAVHIEGAVLLAQPTMQEILAEGTNTRPIVIIDHQGKQALDAAAYFLGHGLQNVRCLRGGIDAWAQEVDSKVRRYKLG